MNNDPDSIVIDEGTEGGKDGGGGGGGGGNPPPPPAPPAPAPPASPADQALLAAGAEAVANGEKVVPLAELVRVRRRAQEAEARAQALTERVAALERTVLEAREALDAVERRQRVDRALADADAIDLESARLLTEVALGGESDIEGAVADLRRRKPFLFRSRGVRAGPAPGGRAPQAAEGLIEAAEEAARTGDRRALLRYLDLRRGA